MAIGWRLVTSEGGERGGEGGGGVSCIRAFAVSLGGHILLLCFWFSLREVVFKLFGRPVGKDCSLDPPWSYADAQVISLVWGLQNSVWILLFWHTGPPV